jgi:YcaO-like protein with predicted kinase domain
MLAELWEHESVGSKRYVGGAHRIRAPAETYADYSRWMPALGITRMANITGLDRIGIPVYNAIRPNSRSLSVSQGKGLDRDAARTSALMESIEYWHAEHIDRLLRWDSASALAREHELLAVERLPLQPGARFDPALPMLWIEGVELLQRKPLWVPFETVTLNKVGFRYEHATFRVSSNGLASGNHLVEAVLHAIYELVERDAGALWWAGNQPPIERTRLDLSTISDPGGRSVLERVLAAELDVAVWDMTSDVGIPSFECCICEREDRAEWRPFGACWGEGTHPSPGVALARALTEAVQTRLTVIAGSRDDSPRHRYARQHDAEAFAYTREIFMSGSGTVDFGAIASLAHDDLSSDLALVLERLRGAGISEVAVVELSRPEIGIPVVKAVIPQLEFNAIFPGYTPGPRARAVATARGAQP